jgi:hypothetical protein
MQRVKMTDNQLPQGWMTQAERLRAIVAHADRHCISSDVLFAVLVALEDAFFIQSDGDEYNNDEAIAAFKALEAEIATQNNAVPAAGSDGSRSDSNRVRASDPPAGNTTVQCTHGDDITVRLTRWCEQPADRAETQGLMDQAAREIERLRLTEEERAAIEWCLSLPMLDRDAVRMMPLRSLLTRLK